MFYRTADVDFFLVNLQLTRDHGWSVNLQISQFTTETSAFIRGSISSWWTLRHRWGRRFIVWTGNFVDLKWRGNWRYNMPNTWFLDTRMHPRTFVFGSWTWNLLLHLCISFLRVRSRSFRMLFYWNCIYSWGGRYLRSFWWMRWVNCLLYTSDAADE